MRKLTAVVFLFLVLCHVVIGQPSDPNDGAAPGENVPISGIEWLLMMGGILGFRKFFKSRKRN